MENQTNLAASTGGASSATKLSAYERGKAVVEDAAEQLGIEPQELNDALKRALENQIEAAVTAGRLTAEAGETVKKRLESQDYPFFEGVDGGPGFGGQPQPHAGMDLEAAATYLRITEARLRQSLDRDLSLADAARDEGRSIDGLVDALVNAQTRALDEAVAAGTLTEERRDEIVSQVEGSVAELVNSARPSREGWRFGRRQDDLARGA